MAKFIRGGVEKGEGRGVGGRGEGVVSSVSLRQSDCCVDR